MKAYDVDTATLEEIVLEVSGELYGGNVTLRDIADATNTRGPRATFTLRVASSRGPGHRHSASWANPGRHLPAACWHAHRDVLAAIFARVPEARIVTAVADYRGADGFAADFPGTGTRNIGAPAYPVTYREVCHCEAVGSWTLDHGRGAPARMRWAGEWREPDDTGEGVTFATLTPGPGGTLEETGVRRIAHLDLMRCPFLILWPDHYRDDGRCRCDEPAERERMMTEWDYTPADFRRVGIEP